MIDVREIKLDLRYPESRQEDITDAFMRGYIGAVEMSNKAIEKLKDENEKLREKIKALTELASIGKLTASQCTELAEDNARLRELVRILKNCADECGDCDTCPINDGPGVLNPWLGCDSLRDRMRELGVEVTT